MGGSFGKVVVAKVRLREVTSWIVALDRVCMLLLLEFTQAYQVFPKKFFFTNF